MPQLLTAALGRQPSEDELFSIAHFLGPDGALKLINVAASQPGANAVELFPRAAAANPRLFRSSLMLNCPLANGRKPADGKI